MTQILKAHQKYKTRNFSNFKSTNQLHQSKISYTQMNAKFHTQIRVPGKANNLLAEHLLYDPNRSLAHATHLAANAIGTCNPSLNDNDEGS